MSSVGCCNARADQQAIADAKNSPGSMWVMNTVAGLAGLTLFVVAILCFVGPLCHKPELASILMVGAGAVFSLAFLATPLRNHRPSWAAAIAILVVLTAPFLPGVFGMYSSSTIGWIYFGSAIAGTGLACLGGSSFVAGTACGVYGPRQ